MSTGTDIIRRYFQHSADRDIDAIVALFSEDATVIDEAQPRRGLDEIRAWQTGAASEYTYTTEILTISDDGPGRYVVDGRLTGDFPGGSADLTWDFTVSGDRIRRLVIAP